MMEENDESRIGKTVSEADIEALWGKTVTESDDDLGMTIKAPEDDDLGATMVDATGDVDIMATLAENDAGPADARPRSDTSVFSYKKDQTVTLRNTRMIHAPEGADLRAVQEALGSDFLIKRVLGQGGMGVIYIARQTSLNRDVAIKMILPGLEEKGNARGKLVSEALTTGELAHPNIVPVYDLGQIDNDQLFYAMKIVNGKPWSSEIGARSERKNIDILLSVADAVAFSHDKGIVHRDLKPENIMLGDYGEVLVMDWGLAASVRDDSMAETITPSNAKAGTPAYMSPEMALGDAGRIGPCSDIYLLGAILYEILTGKRPHTGPNIYVCLMAAAENVIQKTDRNDDLLTVALKAMATRPEDRYATVKEFQEAIREVLSHAESLALSRSASESLADAEAAGSYERYAEAIFAYREAVKLWDGNSDAARGEQEARKKYAATAFGKGDFDLAASTIRDLDDNEARALTKKIAKAKKESETRKRRDDFQ